METQTLLYKESTNLSTTFTNNTLIQNPLRSIPESLLQKNSNLDISTDYPRLQQNLIEGIVNNANSLPKIYDSFKNSIKSLKTNISKEIVLKISMLCDELSEIIEGCLEFNMREDFTKISQFEHLNQYLSLKYDFHFQDLIELDQKCDGSQANIVRLYNPETNTSYVKRVLLLKNKKSTYRELGVLLKLIKSNNPELMEIFQIKPTQDTMEIIIEYGLGDFWHIFNVIQDQNYSVSVNEMELLKKEIYNQAYLLRSLRIYHRDIKPTNIILTESKKIKFIDFGLAEILPEERSEKGMFRVCGTEDYSPDVISLAKKEKRAFVECNIWENELYSIQALIKRDLMPLKLVERNDFDSDFRQFYYTICHEKESLIPLTTAFLKDHANEVKFDLCEEKKILFDNLKLLIHCFVPKHLEEVYLKSNEKIKDSKYLREICSYLKKLSQILSEKNSYNDVNKI